MGDHGGDVGGHGPGAPPGVGDHATVEEGTGGGEEERRREGDRRRAARLRENRQEAGQARISVWVPRARAAYAREVVRAVASGANALPADPEATAELERLRGEAEAARAAESEARRERDEARRGAEEAEARAQASEALAVEQAEEARRAVEEAGAARGELDRLRGAPGLRGRAIRWLAQGLAG